jgi:hypothetical protein
LSVVRGPKGQKSLAQGLPWVLHLWAEALKGACGRGAQEPRPRVQMPLQGSSGYNEFPRVNPGLPWAKFSWPVGPKIYKSQDNVRRFDMECLLAHRSGASRQPLPS